ncbi:MAG: hypothetical protein GY835_23380 [bacterium]|nr:hypothetical protein [bacterium]
MIRRFSWAGLLVLVAGVVLLASRRAPANVTDEGYLLHGIHRVQSGQLPGADFHAYMPLRYWLGAAVAAHQPMELLELRNLELVILVASLLLLWSSVPASSRCPRAVLIAASAVFLYAPGPWHKSLELAATLGVAAAGARALGSPADRSGWTLAFGFTCGLAFGVRMELGLALCAVGALSAGLRGAKGILTFLAGSSALVLVLSSPFAAAGRLRDALGFYGRELISSLGGTGGGTNPFLTGTSPGGSELTIRWIFIAAVLATLGVVTAVAVDAVRRRCGRRQAVFLVAVAVVRLAPLCHGFDASHLLQGLPTAYVACAAARRGRLRLLCLSVLILVHLAVGISTGDSYYTGRWRAPPGFEVPRTGVLAGIRTPPWQLELAGELSQLLKPPGSRARTLVAVPYGPLFICLSEAVNPTGSDIFFPGFDSARELARALRGEQSSMPCPSWVLLDGGVVDHRESPDLRGDVFGLGKAIDEHCDLTRSIGHWRIYRHRNPASTGDQSG